MRLLILAASASLVLTGSALAAQHHHHHHAAAAAAPAMAPGQTPADVLSTEELYKRNVREAGYDHQVK